MEVKSLQDVLKMLIVEQKGKKRQKKIETKCGNVAF